jgi:hypothetical protein
MFRASVSRRPCVRIIRWRDAALWVRYVTIALGIAR